MGAVGRSVGRLVEATYSIFWSSNNTTTNDTGDSCIGVVSSDNSQSPDGTIAPTYHSTPLIMCHLWQAGRI